MAAGADVWQHMRSYVCFKTVSGEDAHHRPLSPLIHETGGDGGF
jgi:hypothetical protein